MGGRCAQSILGAMVGYTPTLRGDVYMCGAGYISLVRAVVFQYPVVSATTKTTAVVADVDYSNVATLPWRFCRGVRRPPLPVCLIGRQYPALAHELFLAWPIL